MNNIHEQNSREIGQLISSWYSETTDPLEKEKTGTNEPNFNHPINLIEIPERQDESYGFYSLYQHQFFCDLKLFHNENGYIHVHSNILCLFGGQLIRELLLLEMKESQEKVIVFSQYSKRTIQAFVDFVYLGGNTFLKKLYQSSERIELFELFEFANVFKADDLISCCTNLISVFAQKKDLEDIKFLAEKYNNAHLKLLSTKLEAIENPLFLKV